MVAIQNPSMTVVTSPETMAENFYYNSTNFLCQTTLGAGSMAIGARVLGLAKFTPATALATTGATLAALALCPSGANSDSILGKPSVATGGQCSKYYRYTLRLRYWTDATQSTAFENEDGNFLGPMKVINNLVESAQGQTVGPGSKISIRRFDGTEIGGITAVNGIVPGSLFLSFSTFDGSPDNCGDQPLSGGQVIYNNTTGDTIDNSTVNDNSNVIGIAPVFFNMGGLNGVFNLPFSNVEIKSLLPLSFNIDVGGVRFGFERNPDGTGKPVKTNPDPELPDSEDDLLQRIYKRLAEIKDCVCQPSSEFKSVDLPLVASSLDCEVETRTLFLPKDEPASLLVQDFTASAILAKTACESSLIEQLPESFLFAATTLEDGRELFSGDISPEVVSLRFKITGFNSNVANRITTYPAANQHKFGSVNFTIKNSNGGGDYVYVFDQETYLPLPRRGKVGKLRVLMKPMISFEVYDTGERV